MKFLSYLYNKCCGNPDPTVEHIVLSQEENINDQDPSQTITTPSPVCGCCKTEPKTLYIGYTLACGSSILFIYSATELYKFFVNSPIHGQSSSSSDLSSYGSSFNSSDYMSNNFSSSADAFALDPIEGIFIACTYVGAMGTGVLTGWYGMKAYENKEAVLRSIENGFANFGNSIYSASNYVKNTCMILRNPFRSAPTENTPLYRTPCIRLIRYNGRVLKDLYKSPPKTAIIGL